MSCMSASRVRHAARRVAAAFFAVVMGDDASSEGWPAESAAEWLGGECGGKVLAPELQEILLKGYEDNEWTKDELPMDGTNVKDAQEIWEAALLGSAHAHGTVRVKPIYKVSLGQWIAAQCSSTEDDGTSSKPSSKAEKDDLAAQGMKRPIELKRLELSAFLGRTVSESETAKGSYRGMPQSMEGGKLAVKFQHPTLDTRIKMCRESGTLNVLDAHYTNLAAEMTDCGEPETERQSTRVLQFWSLTQRNMMGEVEATLNYIDEFRTYYRGRGFPVLYDSEIGQRAMWAATRKGHGKPTANPLSIMSALGSSVGSGSGASSLVSLGSDHMSSVSQRGPGSSEIKNLSEKMESLSDIVTILAEKVGQIKIKTFDVNELTCPVCGEKGHRARDCPEKLKNKKKPGE